MRYFLKLSYHGKNYSGWQIQPHSESIQESIEKAIFTISREKIEITGCGRTDAGVHAREYFAHVDLENPLPEYFLNRLNKILPEDIAVEQLIEMPANAHARFDANYRSYTYQITGKKNPFTRDLATFIYNFDDLNFDKMQEAAALLLKYREFFPFCKSNNDANTMECQLFRSEWEFDALSKKAAYHIAANRFLRGMVRLIVGMCLNVGAGKLSLEKVEESLATQKLLQPSSSAPAHGLALTEIRYPYLQVVNGVLTLV
ncbi:MAG: tRNA pseudouridine(38-40) synthase TruA [Saprospiraceae bacterium]